MPIVIWHVSLCSNTPHRVFPLLGSCSKVSHRGGKHADLYCHRKRKAAILSNLEYQINHSRTSTIFYISDLWKRGEIPIIVPLMGGGGGGGGVEGIWGLMFSQSHVGCFNFNS